MVIPQSADGGNAVIIGSFGVAWRPVGAKAGGAALTNSLAPLNYRLFQRPTLGFFLYEAHFTEIQANPETTAWFSCAHEHQRWTRHACPASSTGT